jgi:hypothetical protein
MLADHEREPNALLAGTDVGRAFVGFAPYNFVGFAPYNKVGEFGQTVSRRQPVGISILEKPC